MSNASDICHIISIILRMITIPSKVPRSLNLIKTMIKTRYDRVDKNCPFLTKMENGQLSFFLPHKQFFSEFEVCGVWVGTFRGAFNFRIICFAYRIIGLFLSFSVLIYSFEVLHFHHFFQGGQYNDRFAMGDTKSALAYGRRYVRSTIYLLSFVKIKIVQILILNFSAIVSLHCLFIYFLFFLF